MKQSLKQQLLNKYSQLNKQYREREDESLLKKSSQYTKWISFESFDGYQEIMLVKNMSEKYSINSPFFLMHDNVASSVTQIDKQEYINFSSYNYLGLNGDKRVNQAAKDAIDQYGTTVSASRIVSGERPPQRLLEKAIADIYKVDDALVFVSGHATNVTTIGYLFDHQDVVIHDELIHNSILEGVKLSGANRLSFEHNSYEHLGKVLEKHRHKYNRVLIVIEGLYSMDGDFPDLPKFIKLKEEYAALLMIDEAHSLGVLGETGKGIAEHFNVNTKDVDIWMGTLSKTLAGCGGYIAGCNALIENLRYKAPGFLYSVGLSCALASASCMALQIMLEETYRVKMLRDISKYFFEKAKENGLDVGNSQGYGVNVIMIGESKKAVKLSNELLKKHINVQPVIYPSVEPNKARLRFFMNYKHTSEQVDYVLNILLDLKIS